MHLTATPPALTITYTPATNRVNPVELRYLRQQVATTTTCCLPTTIQAVVSAAAVAHGLDLTQEAKVLLLEHQMQASQPTMQISR